ncbi:hypothetical protein [Methylobacter sp.]|uniref:hypothetical protein n=1 Tax=Methylobacter sp. TaxID=2051955 RepID=UPI002FDEF080
MAVKKPSFYHTRNKICPNNKQAAELLGVEVAQIEKMDKEGAPLMAERLLLFWDQKHINHPGWDGFIFSRGVLIHKKKRWRPEQLIQMRKDAERVYQLECEIHRLKSWSGLMKLTKKLILKRLADTKK